MDANLENKDLTKEQLIEQVSKLQDRINSLEKIMSVQYVTEDALNISEKNLSAIIDNNADGIVIVDTEGTVLYVNPAAEKLFGRSKNDFLGYPFGVPVSTDKTTDILTVNNGSLYIDVELRIVKVVWLKKPAYQLSIRDITERKLAEKALKESEEKCRVIFDNANDGMFLVDLKTRKFYMCNASCAQMLGYKQDEFNNLEITDIHTKEDFPFIFEQIKTMSTEKNNARGDVGFKRKNGDIFIADLSSTIIPIAGKNYLLVIFRDVSERKQMEEAIIKSEEKFSKAFQNSPDIIMISSIDDGKIIDVNESISRIGDYSKEEVIGKSSLELNFWESIDDRNKFIDELQKSGRVLNFEANFRKKSKEIFTGLISGEIIQLREVKCMLSVLHDITLRKQVEEALRESEEKFKSITENSADAIFIADQNGKYLYINKAVTTLLGFTSEEMRDKTIVDMAPKSRINEYLEIFKRLGTEGKVFAEIELLKKDGNFISTDLNSVILPGGLVYGSCRDITERKLARAELIIAKNKAEESDHLKTAFLHNISHEIRTPLNAIVGFSGFLRNPDLPPEKREHFADIITQSSDQLLSIISDIVSIASIEAGQEKIQENEININLVCKLINDQFNSKAREKNIKLDFKTWLADDESIIITDATKLTQILSNLVNNAFKFTQQGYINFGYTLKDTQLEFYVEDSGIGISSGMHEEIFKRFRQIETTDSRKYGGSGLGLSISKAYVEMLGGKIWLTSKANRGTIFYFTLPYKKVTSKEISEKLSGNELSFEFEKLKTLLIAEDEDSNFMLLEEFFSDVKIIIIRALNGLEAVEKCKSNPQIDLVLMDIKMPEMDGFEATKKIKEFRPDLYIIAQTAFTTEEDKNKAFACGCNDFISKPIKREILLTKMKEQLLN